MKDFFLFLLLATILLGTFKFLFPIEPPPPASQLFITKNQIFSINKKQHKIKMLQLPLKSDYRSELSKFLQINQNSGSNTKNIILVQDRLIGEYLLQKKRQLNEEVEIHRKNYFIKLVHASKSLNFRVNESLIDDWKCDSDSGEGKKLFVEFLGVKDQAIYAQMRQNLRAFGWVDSVMKEKIVFECSLPLKQQVQTVETDSKLEEQAVVNKEQIDNSDENIKWDNWNQNIQGNNLNFDFVADSRDSFDNSAQIILQEQAGGQLDTKLEDEKSFSQNIEPKQKIFQSEILIPIQNVNQKQSILSHKNAGPPQHQIVQAQSATAYEQQNEEENIGNQNNQEKLTIKEIQLVETQNKQIVEVPPTPQVADSVPEVPPTPQVADSVPEVPKLNQDLNSLLQTPSISIPSEVQQQNSQSQKTDQKQSQIQLGSPEQVNIPDQMKTTLKIDANIEQKSIATGILQEAPINKQHQAQPKKEILDISTTEQIQAPKKVQQKKDEQPIPIADYISNEQL